MNEQEIANGVESIIRLFAEDSGISEAAIYDRREAATPPMPHATRDKIGRAIDALAEQRRSGTVERKKPARVIPTPVIERWWHENALPPERGPAHHLTFLTRFDVFM